LQTAADLEFIDPYTAYLPPAQAEQAQQRLDGEYEGIGVYIEVVDQVLTIVSPMPDSPAEEAGLLPGDVLVAVDGTTLTGLSIEEAQNLVQGPEGTTVQLTILRPGQEEPFTVDVERRRIDTPVVEYELDEASGVAVISVSIFNDKTTEQLDKALNQAIADEVAGIVLDLRFNGGGWVTAAQEMIGRFVPVDSGVALYEDDDQAEGNELVEVPIIGGGPEVFDIPLTVLVNGGTASAAEIVAGALKDYDRAQIVGVTTFGKGSVQRVHEFEDNSSLRITIAIWLTPDQTVIDGAGIVPNVEVQEPEDLPKGQDPQLERAIQVTTGR
jgi:carboxyl-terminal processing protease